ncbi:MAG: hypothetical protein AAB834_02010 [Patescibacteria group bacterium]
MGRSIRPSHWSKKTWLVAIVCVVAIAIAAIVFASNRLTARPSPELINAQGKTDIQIYYPSNLPEGFSYMNQSVKASTTAIIYTLTYDNDKRLSVSCTAKPSNAAISKFHSQTLTDKTKIPSPEGDLVVGTAYSQTVASLVTDEAWVIMNTTAAIDEESLTRLASSFTPIPN